MTESGHAHIVGRVKEMINRGGENVYPVEVEGFLRSHPKIHDAQVFGVPDHRMGEEVAVWVHLKENQMMTADELKTYCKGQVLCKSTYVNLKTIDKVSNIFSNFDGLVDINV